MEKTALEKWEKADLWRLDEFATLCCGFDPKDKLVNDRPDTYYIEENEIREEIRRAVISGSLKAVDEPDSSRADSTYGYDLYVRPTHAIEWASHRFSAFPNFSKNIAQFTPAKNKKPPVFNRLEQNSYWSKLSKDTQKAIDTFPAWKRGQSKVQKGNVLGWLREEHKLNDREAHIVKNTLSEEFQIGN